MIPAMASQQALRPLLRLTRPATQIARITTTTRTKAAAAATATAPKPAPKPAVSRAATPIVKKPYTKPAPKPPSPPPPPPPATPEADAAIGPSLSSSTPLPTAPFDNGTSNGNTSGSEDGNGNGVVDWTRSYYGLGTARFPKEVVDILLQPVNPADVEVKPDGIIYLPEIKYRRILNQAFGPGGWGLVPKGEVVVGERIVTREYALIAEGRFISQAQGENGYFNVENLPSAVEGCKSNALMRCCKDLGIASDLWDPVFIRAFKKEYALEVWCEHVTTGKKKLVWTRKDVPIAYPFKKTQ
ncbi:Mitochondrial genome maintenance protein MGM101 [Colletotrichum sp. SAR11_240]|nr:Mitochondrial genome maintenance protein MGM101 [Colletotrichum sp. SAR11_240]